MICDGLFFAVLVQAAVSDWNTKKIENYYPVAILILELVMMLGTPEITDSFFRALVGAGVSAAPLLLSSMAVKGAFGGGDIKLMASAGCYLGPAGGFYGLFLGLLSAALYGVYLKARKKISWKERIPLGPFLALGLVGAGFCYLP